MEEIPYYFKPMCKNIHDLKGTVETYHGRDHKVLTTSLTVVELKQKTAREALNSICH